MRRNRTATDRTDNFEKRLKQTWDSELEPEQITPNTAGPEELTSYEEKFPLVEEFNQTNMRSGGRRIRDGQTQTGRDRE